MTKHLFEIRRNAEGSKLAYLSPIDEDDKILNRIRFLPVTIVCEALCQVMEDE